MWDAGRKQIQLNREMSSCGIGPPGTGGRDRTLTKAEDVFRACLVSWVADNNGGFDGCDK